MILHESTKFDLRKTKYLKTRDFQLLVYSMEMISSIFEGLIDDSKQDINVGQIAYESYSSSPLYVEHNFFVKSSIKLAMKTLSDRNEFFKLMCPDLAIPQIKFFFEQAVKNLKVVYTTANSIFTSKNLHHMP